MKTKTATVETLSRLLEKQPAPCLFAFDFDGTLVGFRSDPNRVALSRAQTELLGRLALRHPVAVISGRSLADLRQKLRGLPVHLVGNHGSEAGSAADRRAARARWTRANREWIRSFRRYAERNPALKDVWIEDKRYSLSAHFRRARDPIRVEAALAEWIRTLRPAPRVVPGVRVVNLVPRDAHHKGQALRALIRALRCRSAVFAGDDTTDEDVFRMNLGKVITVKVGYRPRETAARYRLADRHALTRLIRRLARGAPRDPT